MDKEYNYTFGVLTALAIIFVVAGHLNSDILTFDGLFPYYSYHMPLFMFISGYFYKKQHEDNIGQFLLKKIKRLVIPYFIWNVFYGVLLTIFRRLGFAGGQQINLKTLFVQPFIDGRQFYFNLSAWFILALFIVEVLYLLIMKLIHSIVKNEKAALVVLFCILSIMQIAAVNYALSTRNDGIYMVIERTIFLSTFYCMGNLYKELIEEYDNRINNYVYFFVVVGLSMAISLHYNWIPTFSAVFAQFFNNPYVQYLVAVLGIMFWLRIAKIITPIVERDGIIIYIGKNSFSIMMHHIAIIYVLSLLVTVIVKSTGIFNDADVNAVIDTPGYWYCPNGNKVLLLFYLVFSIAIIVLLCRLKDNIIIYYKKCMTRRKEKYEG